MNIDPVIREVDIRISSVRRAIGNRIYIPDKLESYYLALHRESETLYELDHKMAVRLNPNNPFNL